MHLYNRVLGSQLQSGKLLGKLLRKLLFKLLWKLLGKVLGKVLRKVLRKVLGKWWSEQNYLRKTVIDGNIAFRMG